MNDIAKHLHWCAVHGDQLQAIKAMEQGAAEIEQLQERLAAMDAVRLQGWRNAEHAGEQRDEALAEVERLRAALTWYANAEIYEHLTDHARAALGSKP